MPEFPRGVLKLNILEVLGGRILNAIFLQKTVYE